MEICAKQPKPLWQTPWLLEGYGTRIENRLVSFSGAVFGQIDWKVTKKLSILPGLRWNYDEKQVDLNHTTYGGLETDDPALIALKNSVYNAQEFTASVNESNFSGQLTAAFQFAEKLKEFVIYSTSFKPMGINLGGLPRENGHTMIELARVEPEFVTHWEVGIKSSPSRSLTFNAVAHNTNINKFQTLVQTPDLSVNRGYLANAEEVNVFGVEVDANFRASKSLSFFGSLAYTDGKYVDLPMPQCHLKR